MNLTIEKQKFTLGAKYDISVPGRSYHAEKKILSLGNKLQLQAEDGSVLARITSHFSLLRSKYDFELSGGKLYRFWCEKLWTRVFVCENEEESFRLYEHSGLNYSIFKDGSQIAAFSKNRVSIGGGELYEIRANEDANVIIVLCLALTVDMDENSDDDSTVMVDCGRIGPEDHPFDESWEPK
jgi:uncharacterized protein YxjI